MARAQRRTCLLILAALALAAGGGALWWRTRLEPGEQFHRALGALHRGDLERPLAAAQQLEKEQGYESHARLLRGAVLLRTGEFALAIQEFAKVAPQGELREPALLLTGECLYRLGRLSEAEFLMRQLATEQPSHPDPHRWLGAIYYDLGANDAAIAELSRVIELAPGDYRPHRLIGLMRHDFEENASAVVHYRKALALSPPADVRETMLREMAQCLIAERKYDDALEALSEARPDALSLTLQAECHWSLGDDAQAGRLLENARQRDPNERELLLLEARMHLAQDDAERAVAPVQRLLAANRHDAEARYQLALAYRQLGRTEESEDEMQRWRDSSALLERLTQLSIDAIRQPRDVSIRRELAEVCDELGKHELAAAWRRAVEGAGRPQSETQPVRVPDSATEESGNEPRQSVRVEQPAPAGGG